MSCESLVIDGCETLVLEVEVPVILEVAEQGPPGPPGADGEDGEPGPPGTTDYNDLINKPTLGTAAAQNVEAFATAAQGAKADSAVQPAALSTTNSSIGSLSTSTSAALSTTGSSLASLSTGLSTSASGIASLSASTSTGLSTSASGIASLSTALSSSSSGVASLSTSTSSGLSTATSALASLSTSVSSGLSTSGSRIDSLSTSTSSGLSTATSSIASLSTSTSTALSTAASAVADLDAQNVKLSGAQTISGTKSFAGEQRYKQGAFMRFFNTADEVTNTETVRMLWNANQFLLDSATSGTGTSRVLSLSAGLVPLVSVATTLPLLQLGRTAASTVAGNWAQVNGNHTGSTGSATTLVIAPTVAQSGTAGYTALDVSVTQTTVGSGVPLLQRWAVNSVVYGSMRSNGHLSTRGLVTAGSVDGLTTGTSYLNALGSFAMAPTTLTADTTLGITHGSVILNPASAPVVITLPPASTCPGRVYPIKRVDGVGGAHTIVPNGPELIDGSNQPYQLNRQYSGVTLRSMGTRWVTEAVFEPQALSQQAPVLNIMSDSGRGTVKANPLTRAVGAYSNTRLEAFLGTSNGAGAWAEVGKFIHDNTTNGGVAGVLTATTSDLLVAMGRSGTTARYGVEFYISERTSGTGTSIPAGGAYPNNYLGSVNGGTAMFGAGNVNTFVAWMRCIDQNQIVIAGVPVWINGRAQAANIAVITPAMGWVHVRVVTNSAIGYDNAAPRIYTEANQKWQIACPAFVLGYADPGIHLAPLPTVNELMP